MTCEACGGKGLVYSGRRPDDGDYECAYCKRACGSQGHWDMISRRMRCPTKECPHCQACPPCDGMGEVITRDGTARPSYARGPGVLARCPGCGGSGRVTRDVANDLPGQPE
jgi:hypothetical protein